MPDNDPNLDLKYPDAATEDREGSSPVQPLRTTSPSAWRDQGRSRGRPLALPSGKVALVQPAPIQTFIKRGYIPNSLLPIVQEALGTGKDPDMATIVENMDPEMIADMFTFLDNVLIASVVEPKVSEIPLDDNGNEIPVELRDQDQIYVDEVDEEDKNFIVQFAMGGTRDLERFRSEQETAVAAVVNSKGLAEPT